MAKQYREKLRTRFEEEIHILLKDLDRIRKEYDIVQLERKYLLDLKSKYGPGGDFDLSNLNDESSSPPPNEPPSDSSSDRFKDELARITKKLTTPNVFPWQETTPMTPKELEDQFHEFSQLIADDTRFVLRYLGKAREELRSLCYELGTMICLKSKYGPGGEFDPEW
ncbi:1192_t:CDS:2 [Acaulospora colombiana]|uniref:1192_t:CDS:1 n=1 Tax=Acaulospora colombiana TaxID=27376 RepID=A0ACA9PTF5_9GLOM|nr:1192_t:CDS:2 [Acaulospora colombiana]